MHAPAERHREPRRAADCRAPDGGLRSILWNARGLAAAGVHLEVRIAPEAVQRDERRPRAARQPLLGAAVAPLVPDRTDQRRELGRRRAGAQRAAEIFPLAPVETQV